MRSVITEAETPSLNITPSDVYIEQSLEGGYDLWIRKKPDIGSVLLTESTADPEKKLPVYALRNPSYHPVNGDEKRMLNGQFLNSARKLYSLIDSTPEEESRFGEAFHIFIPYIVEYGYPWSRTGEIQVLDGTFLNIRTFEKPYGDYGGAFRDNPFILRVVQRPKEGPPEENYMPDTVKDFKEIAEKNKGTAILSLGKDELADEIVRIIKQSPGPELDFVLALDTTQSMEDDIPFLRKTLVPLLKEQISRFERFRAGMILYKDYMEEYLTRVIPFQENLDYIQRVLDGVQARGGRDIPEAVFEALYAGIHSFDWTANSRIIVLIGDAPPHPRPRGSVTGEMVNRNAGEIGIEIHTIILPQ
ncbi:MAG: hypothetical protein DRP87_04890 [Spirochaetes bacterium]|nr:MAG: hypothetical protein DRP87_04890 [Spirochaetota bacterium]